MNRQKTKSGWLDESLRLAVLSRDDWLCQRCGSAGPLHIHHIHLRSQGGPDLVDNLLTLCWQCHDEVHRMGQPQGPAKPSGVGYSGSKGCG